MPQARLWTQPADTAIVTMRQDGATWAAISRLLGLSRNTVIERGRRLRATAPARPVVPPASRDEVDLEDPCRPALPAGHPLTWGLLTSEPYPGDR